MNITELHEVLLSRYQESPPLNAKSIGMEQIRVKTYSKDNSCIEKHLKEIENLVTSPDQILLIRILPKFMMELDDNGDPTGEYCVFSRIYIGNKDEVITLKQYDRLKELSVIL